MKVSMSTNAATKIACIIALDGDKVYGVPPIMPVQRQIARMFVEGNSVIEIEHLLERHYNIQLSETCISGILTQILNAYYRFDNFGDQERMKLTITCKE